MQRQYLFSFLVVLVFGLTSLARAQISINEIDKIDKYLNQRSEMEKYRYFADASYNEDAKWMEFPASENNDSSIVHQSDNQALVWRIDSFYLVALTLQSQSGDWVQYVSYIYRPDGSLAKLTAELRTFYGNVIRLRKMYFDRQGKIIRDKTIFKDLESGKAIAKDKVDGNYIEVECSVYQVMNRLPFYSLYQRK